MESTSNDDYVTVHRILFKVKYADGRFRSGYRIEVVPESINYWPSTEQLKDAVSRWDSRLKGCGFHDDEIFPRTRTFKVRLTPDGVASALRSSTNLLFPAAFIE